MNKPLPWWQFLLLVGIAVAALSIHVITWYQIG